MTIYNLLRKLIRAAARSGSEFTADEAKAAIVLVNELERHRAFGTLVNIERGEYGNERH